jgi:hypothetical protein
MKRTRIYSGIIALMAMFVVLAALTPAHALDAKVSGQINQMVLYADDGDQNDFFVTDNDSSSTRIRFTGEEAFGAVKAGVQFEIEAQRNASNRLTMNQNSEGAYNGSETGFEWNDRWLNVYFDTKFGKFEIGKGDTAANNTTEVDLSGTSVVTYSDMTATGGGFRWINENGTPLGGPAGPSISSTHYNFDGILSRSERVRYNTPTFAGFQAAASVSNGDGWDSSLWYAAEVYGKLAAAIGYTKPQSRAEGTDYQLAGSVSWLMPFGLNLTAAYGIREFEAAGRDNAAGWYGKIGYITGIHAVSVEYGLTQDFFAEGYDGTVWGAAYVINPWKPVELYVAYRNYSLNVDVAGISDPGDIQVAMLGTRVKF